MVITEQTGWDGHPPSIPGSCDGELLNDFKIGQWYCLSFLKVIFGGSVADNEEGRDCGGRETP